MNFSKLVEIIKSFSLEDQLIDEKELETKLYNYLKSKNLDVERQFMMKGIRNDLIINDGNKRYCLELKVIADRYCLRQLDRYINIHPDGLILVCWKASKSIRDTFQHVKKSIKVPIQLIEVRDQQAMF